MMESDQESSLLGLHGPMITIKGAPQKEEVKSAVEAPLTTLLSQPITDFRKLESKHISSPVGHWSFIKCQEGDIWEHYERLQMLGEGKFGKVFLVKRNIDGKEWAVKEIPKSNLKEQNIDLARFKEIEIMKQLMHPNIIKLHQTWDGIFYFYIVMECLKGSDLHDYLTQCEFSLKHIKMFAKTMLGAINYIHKNNVIHRDIKPENIILKSAGKLEQATLIDFGLAKRVKSPSQMHYQPHGTVLYMAPEVLKGQYNSKCDLWSLGVIIYMMSMTVLPPFYAETEKDMVLNITRMKKLFIPKQHEDKWKTLPEDIRDFIKGLLRFNFQDRLTAELALKHPFIGMEKSKPKPARMKLDVFKYINRFKDFSKLRRLALHYIAMNLDFSVVQQIEKDFKRADSNQEGFISLEKMEIMIREKCPNIDQKVLNRILQKVDLNKDGKIDIKEFVAACQESVHTTQDYQIEQAFYFFDHDEDGRISITDLKYFLVEAQLVEIEDIMRQTDANRDGFIDMREFKQMMKGANFGQEKERLSRLKTMLDL